MLNRIKDFLITPSTKPSVKEQMLCCIQCRAMEMGITINGTPLGGKFLCESCLNKKLSTIEEDIDRFLEGAENV